MADNNNNRQNPDKFNRDNQLKYQWGADDGIMKIIIRRDNSPETKELVERRIELTKPGHMRYQWHKNWTGKFSSLEDQMTATEKR